MVRIGGLALEPPIGFFAMVKKFADQFLSKVDEYENLLTGNPIWVMRTKGVARITAEDAIALGASGPYIAAMAWFIDSGVTSGGVRSRELFPSSSGSRCSCPLTKTSAGGLGKT
jgi:Ni,Fe-hydrogenase III large subunit